MNILVIDDHALIRDALARVLAGLVPDMRIHEAADSRSALEVIARHPQLDLVLLDLALPGMHGLTLLETLRQQHPAIGVVVISATADRRSVLSAMDRGAVGFIPKSSSNQVLKHALQLVLAGGVYVPPEVVGRGGAEPAAASPLDTAPDTGRTTTGRELGLTDRQTQILARLMKGQSNKQICRELKIAESTVKNQITAILKSLGVTTRTQAVLAVSRLGLVLPAARSGDAES